MFYKRLLKLKEDTQSAFRWTFQFSQRNCWPPWCILV
jgi:hypothetical protein